MAKVGKIFLLIELLDKDINALLTGLRSAFGQKTNTNIHITVRGPRNSTFLARSIAFFESVLENEPILIHNVGIFENNKTYVVYLKASNPYLKKIWHKPDYKNEFNPHISVYIGKDEQIADSIYNFLKNERIEVLCFEYKLIPYLSKQKDLFPEEVLPTQQGFNKLINVGKVKKDILDRARIVYRNQSASTNALTIH